MALIFNNVSYCYDPDLKTSSLALKNVNLKIEDGEFIGLIGHTGSGKSTLVQHMNGLLRPTAGEIFYDGRDISDRDFDMKELRSNVGLVFQYPEHQLFEATVFEDVCFGPKNLGLDKKECELRAFTALNQVGLSHDYFYASPFELSGGQKRRVAIAGVLAMHPKILVLDEPTAGLDPKGRDDILGQLRKLHDEEGLTIVLVSHSMEDVANCVNRIVVMNEGRVVLDDIPKAVFAHHAELEEIGLAAPQVTYIMEALAAKGYPVDTGATTIAEAADSIVRVFGR